MTEDSIAYQAYLEYESEPYTSLEDFEDRYCGEWESEEEYTEETFRECNEIPKHLEYYIDWEAMARDWFMSDFYSVEKEGKVHVFRR